MTALDSWVDIEPVRQLRQEEWSQVPFWSWNLSPLLCLPFLSGWRRPFGDVFARLDPEQFQRRGDPQCEWRPFRSRGAQVTQGEVVAIMTARRYGAPTTVPWAKGTGAIRHWSNGCWASSHGLALGQTKVDEKSNEITGHRPSCYSCWSSTGSASSPSTPWRTYPEGDSHRDHRLRPRPTYHAWRKHGPGESRPAV